MYCTSVLYVNMQVFSMWISVLYADTYALYGQVYSMSTCKCTLSGHVCALWTGVLYVNMPVYSKWTSLLYADTYALYGQVYSVYCTIVLYVNMPVYSMWTSVLYADTHVLYGQVYSVDNCPQCETCQCTLCGQACALWDRCTLWTIVFNVNMPVYSMWTSVLYVDKHVLYGQVYSVDNCFQCEHASVLYVDKCTLCGHACALWTGVLCGQLCSM